MHYLWQAKLDNRLPHALLLVGPKGQHKINFAYQFSRALLCEQASQQGEPCDNCQACRLTQSRVHPNLFWVEPEKAGTPIKIDQIRHVTDFINQTSMQQGYRTVIIHPADHMNVQAANALLKSLEEPAPGVILMLVCDQVGRLPATILSRCHRLNFPAIDENERLQLLNEQAGRNDLFQALQQLTEGKADPISTAALLQHGDAGEIIEHFLSWVVDIMRLQLNGGEEGVINKDYLPQLAQLKQSTQLKHNVTLMDHLQQLRVDIERGIHFNKQLLLESLFVKWVRCA